MATSVHALPLTATDAGTQGTGKNCRIGGRRMPTRRVLPSLIAGSVMFVSSQGHAFTCFSSADQVRQENPAAWPSWTLRAPGHEGTKCWYSTIRAAAHDNQTPVIPRSDHSASREHFERDGEVTGLAPHADNGLFMALLSFVESSRQAYRLKASNAAPPISTAIGTIPK
jgi:hypothetical protein